jgi:glycerol-3-phosphate dehydrogenase (NAD(P)+)
MGADPMTFAGLAGMGDLILTTTGSLSRNRALGIALAEGQSFATYRAAHRSVAEGANTSKAAAALAERRGVEMPITGEVCQILFSGKSAAESAAELMERDLKSERLR